MNRRTLETADSWWRMRHNHVWIDERKLREDSYLAVGRGEEFHMPAWDFEGIYPQSNEAFPRFIFWTSVVNFRYNYPVMTNGTLEKFAALDVYGKEQRGANALQAIFYRAFSEGPIRSGHILHHMRSSESAKEFFRGTGKEIPMLFERRVMLLEAANIVLAYFDGDPINIFKEAKYRAHSKAGGLGIIDTLTLGFPMGFGQDRYPAPGTGELLSFNKRANLVAVMYEGRAQASKGELPVIEDIAEVGPIPDYQLPRSYKADGIFRYSDELNRTIDQGIPVTSDSAMQIETRGATVWAQLHELKCVNEARQDKGLAPLHIGHVDAYRWFRGRKYTGQEPLICDTTDC